MKKRWRDMEHGRRWWFPGGVLGVYLLLWAVAPAKAVPAFKASLAVGWHLLPSLGLVFICMAALNLFIKLPDLAAWMRNGSSLVRMVLAASAGILSTGPIFAWYPMLKDLREKGMAQGLLAVFLVNRAVKPFLLPMMVAMFGWPYVLVLTALTVAGSFGVGWIVAMVTKPLHQISDQ